MLEKGTVDFLFKYMPAMYIDSDLFKPTPGKISLYQTSNQFFSFFKH